MLHTNTVTVTTYNTLYEVQIIKCKDCCFCWKKYDLKISVLYNILILKAFEKNFRNFEKVLLGSQCILPWFKCFY